MRIPHIYIDSALILTLSALLVFPKECFGWIVFVLSFYDFAFAKMLSVAFFVKYRKQLQSFFIKKSDETFEGVPKDELLEYLFSEKKFPAKEVQEKWSISAKKYSKISAKLQECGILQKIPPQNALALNEEFTRAEVVAVFSFASCLDELKRQMKIVRA